MAKPKHFMVAQVGKTYGLHGDLKLHLYTDFPEQFQVGYSFDSSAGRLEINRINLQRGTIAFKGYDGVDFAKKLTNAKLYATEEETKERCVLQEGEHFWFDIEGCEVLEDGKRLGKVVEIQRLADVNYLFIETDSALTKDGLPKNFLIPYIDRYILEADTEAKVIHTVDTKELLEAS